ncbi:hypothetical protein V6Z11_A06G161200 [Gossypium hirsutum]
MRGCYARVCVKIDLMKPLQPKLLMEKKHVKVEYEGLYSSIRKRIVGGSSSSHNVINDIVKFKDHWSSCDLLNVGIFGCHFTWVRKNDGRIILQEKLDRVLWNSHALLENPNAKAIVLPHLCSNYHPILFLY